MSILSGCHIIVLLALVFLPGAMCTITAATHHVGPGYPWGNLEGAAGAALPGDTILFHQGTYAGGQFVSALAGSPAGWIAIIAAPGDAVTIAGGATAWQLSDPAYVLIEGFTFEHQTVNGVNIDDGGDYSTPAHHVHIRSCAFRAIDGAGNNDLLKLSGLDDFEITRCTFADGSPGGSGIDMVGCHRGTIESNRFERMGSNAIQAKGGSSSVTIARNFFLHGGARTLNLGGSTGLAYFRPLDAPYEAADLLVWANVIVGSDAPIAYVGAVGVHVVNNSIVRPQVWVTRILQETVDATRIVSCGDNSFRQNLVFQGTIRTETNVGPNTRPESFVFSDNYWHNYQNPAWSGPALPVPDETLVLGPDPQFADTLAHNYRLRPTSPAIGIIAQTDPPLEDFDRILYAFPRSAGAFEGNRQSTAVEDAPAGTPRSLLLRSYPNPFNATTQIEFWMPEPGPLRLELFSPDGRRVAELIDAHLEAGTHTVALEGSRLATGLYLLRARTATTTASSRLILVR